MISQTIRLAEVAHGRSGDRNHANNGDVNPHRACLMTRDVVRDQLLHGTGSPRVDYRCAPLFHFGLQLEAA